MLPICHEAPPFVVLTVLPQKKGCRSCLESPTPIALWASAKETARRALANSAASEYAHVLPPSLVWSKTPMSMQWWAAMPRHLPTTAPVLASAKDTPEKKGCVGKKQLHSDTAGNDWRVQLAPPSAVVKMVFPPTTHPKFASKNEAATPPYP